MLDDHDLDEVDLAILHIIDDMADWGVSACQAATMLRERIEIAYDIVSSMEDRRADDPMPSFSIH